MAEKLEEKYPEMERVYYEELRRGWNAAWE
jgi:hypothetical protein